MEREGPARHLPLAQNQLWEHGSVSAGVTRLPRSFEGITRNRPEHWARVRTGDKIDVTIALRRRELEHRVGRAAICVRAGSDGDASHQPLRAAQRGN